VPLRCGAAGALERRQVNPGSPAYAEDLGALEGKGLHVDATAVFRDHGAASGPRPPRAGRGPALDSSRIEYIEHAQRAARTRAARKGCRCTALLAAAVDAAPSRGLVPPERFKRGGGD